MAKITDDMLLTIFNYVEREISDINLLKTISYLNLSYQEQIAPDGEMPILSGNYIIDTFFQANNNLPTDTEEREAFKATALFTVRLSLLKHGSESLLDNTSTEKEDYISNAIKLIKDIEKIFALNNLDAQLYLLNRLMAWQRTDIFKKDKELNRLLTAALKACVNICCQNLGTNEVNDRSKSSLKDFLIFIANNPVLDNNLWKQVFIEQSKQYFNNQITYDNRLIVIGAVLESWERLQDKITGEDIHWLKQIAEDITKAPKKSTSCFNKLLAELNQYFDFLNTSKYILAFFGVVCGPVLAFSHTMGVMYQEAREGALSSVRDYYKTLQETPQKYTEAEWQILDKAIENLKQVYNLHDLNQAQITADLASTINSVYPYLIGTAFLVAPYIAYRFFQAPTESKAISLPSWVNILEQEINQEQPQNRMAL